MEERIEGSLSNSAAVGLFWTIFGAGIVMIILGPIIDNVMMEFCVSQTMAGVLSSSYAIGGLIGMLLSPIAWRLSKPRRVLTLGTLICALSLTGFSVAWNYAMVFFSFLVGGIMNGLIFTYSTTIMSNCGPETKRASNINYLYSAFGIGVIVGPFAAQLILNSTGNWRHVLYLPIAIMTIASLWTFSVRTFFTCTEHDKVANDRESLSRIEDVPEKRRVWNRNLLSLFIALALYVGAEGSVNVWVVKYFTDIHSFTGSGYILTLIWIAITLGRVLLGRFASSSPNARMVIYMAVVSSIALVGGAMTSSIFIAAGLYILVGFGFAGIYPSLISMVSSAADSNKNLALSIATSAGDLGAIFFPPLIGAIAEYIGFRIAMELIAIFLIVAIMVLRFGFAKDMSSTKGV